MMIQFHEVSKKFSDDTVVLDKVTFSLEEGSFNFLIGPTGSGKTTIFRLIIRDLFPTEGTIMLGDWNVAKLPKGKVTQLRRKVGMVFQDLKLLIDRTVIENTMMPLLFSKISEKEAKNKATEILVNIGLEGKIKKFPLELSGGERQRVAIARALVFEPQVVLADEPTGNLDINTSFQVMELLESINKKGVTVFIATHNEKIIEKIRENIFVIENKKVNKK